MDFVYNREAKTDIRDQSNHLVFHGLPLPSPADGFHSPRPQMASAPSPSIGLSSLARNWLPLPSPSHAMHSPPPSNAMLSLPFKRNALPSPSNAMLSLPFKRNALPPFKRNALPSPSNAMLSPPLPFKRNALPPLQTQCSPLPFKRNALPSPSNAMLSLPFKRNAFPSTQTLFHPSSFLLGRKEVTNKAALPLADLVTGVGNIATFADCEKKSHSSENIHLKLTYYQISECWKSKSTDSETFHPHKWRRSTIVQHPLYKRAKNITGLIVEFESGSDILHHPSGYVADGGISTDHSGERAPDSSWGMVRVGNSRNQANHTRKAAAMDNEEDKEEEQSEILAEDDIEGEQSEEEPSPAPTNHRALASRRNTSSPTKHPPQPQTLPQLPISPLSTPVALSPILAFATTPAQHRVINKTMT
ncbi:hypothetical protein BLNAU_20428 [Blattamonas nauphoetae]|uniref:Uncharacterized protein n=1 Tax=Blattamonas nauphoetae TaxID=2049346 RepID=A0ABQ9WYP1_9EUKA|nr:hypothetical protein BLNAU_20428 [Blattamonas nauphoetae]